MNSKDFNWNVERVIDLLESIKCEQTVSKYPTIEDCKIARGIIDRLIDTARSYKQKEE